MDEISEYEVTQVGDEVNVSDALDDYMSEYLEEVAYAFAKKHSLNDEQRERLLDRLSWQLILLPDLSSLES